MYRIICLLGALLFLTTLSAQERAGDLTLASKARIQLQEDSLTYAGYLALHDTLPERRFKATKEIILGLKSALKEKNSFSYPFSRLNSISIQYPADSSFRIFTWQLFVDDNTYRYYGAIQLNTPELKLIPLIDRSKSMSVVEAEQQELSSDRWYGALYYRILQQDHPNGRYYLLFGYDGADFHNKRKLVDVLRIDSDGKVRLGAPFFLAAEGTDHPPTKHRIIKTYATTTSFTLNFDVEFGFIIFDHTVAKALPDGSGITYYPDGTYEGYRPVDGYWQYDPKLFHQMMEEPPSPMPRKSSGTDIFGRPRKD